MRLHKGLTSLLIILILFGFLVVATNVLTRQLIHYRQTEEAILSNAVKKTLERETVFKQFFQRSQQTFSAIRNSKVFNDYLNQPLKAHQQFSEMALILAQSQQAIMKIRYIDAKGMERVRIDRKNIGEHAKIVSDALLQDKSQRYFYLESKTRPANLLWFSELDLNEENGKVERPFKPTLRSVMPLADENGFKGILIVNYFIQPLFDQLSNTPLYNMILLDGNGDVLQHYDTNNNWSRYTDGVDLRQELPEFEAILTKPVHRTKLYFSRQLKLPLAQKLILVLSLNQQYLDFQHSLSRKALLYSSSITLFITVIFGLIFTRMLHKFFADYANRGQNIDKLTLLNKRINNLLLTNKVYMDMASDGVHILDEKGNLVAFSHSFASMLGYSDQETADLNVRDWEARLDADEIEAAMRSLGNEPRTIETQHRCKNGNLIDVEIHCKWIDTPEGKRFYASSRDITERLSMEKELQRLASTDSLTGLAVRKVYREQLSFELERAVRQSEYSVSVVILDIDYFKTVNDSYGHRVGDKVLQHIASILKDEVRNIDTVARLGGEEFGLILTNTDEQAALYFTNRLRQRIAESRCSLAQHQIAYTVSLGLSQIVPQDSNIDDIMERADKALYRAKHLGRNRVESYSEMMKCGEA